MTSILNEFYGYYRAALEPRTARPKHRASSQTSPTATPLKFGKSLLHLQYHVYSTQSFSVASTTRVRASNPKPQLQYCARGTARCTNRGRYLPLRRRASPARRSKPPSLGPRASSRFTHTPPHHFTCYISLYLSMALYLYAIASVWHCARGLPAPAPARRHKAQGIRF